MRRSASAWMSGWVIASGVPGRGFRELIGASAARSSSPPVTAPGNAAATRASRRCRGDDVARHLVEVDDDGAQAAQEPRQWTSPSRCPGKGADVERHCEAPREGVRWRSAMEEPILAEQERPAPSTGTGRCVSLQSVAGQLLPQCGERLVGGEGALRGRTGGGRTCWSSAGAPVVSASIACATWALWASQRSAGGRTGVSRLALGLVAIHPLVGLRVEALRVLVSSRSRRTRWPCRRARVEVVRTKGRHPRWPA